MPRYRARQLLGWVHDRHCDSFADMTNLSRADRQMLADQAAISTGDIVADRLATDGTRKLLMQWRHADSPDPRLPVVLDAARQTECVLIPSDERRTACISSQIGCPVGCRFCASGLGGLDGNLSRGTNRRAGVGSGQARWASASATWSSWAWASRSPTSDP
jgi:23S rRNA (adenine2503-C2)-methyltransferase